MVDFNANLRVRILSRREEGTHKLGKRAVIGLFSHGHSPGKVQRDMASTIYEPLDPEDRTIRLMKLLPGAFDDEIQIILRTTTTSHKRTPKYEALSYAWGSKDDPVDVFIRPRARVTRSKHRSQSHRPDALKLTITQNLAAALRHLRRPDTERTLWIDAICVNQQDLRERGHQVERMADVYRSADRVLVWLGPQSDDSALAVRTLYNLSSYIEVDWRLRSMRPSLQAESHWADRGRFLPYDDGTWHAIAHLLGRNWFRRLWIWQEVRLARRATVVCGYDKIVWDDFGYAIFCLYAKPRTIWVPDILYDLLSIAFRISRNSTNMYSLESLLKETSDCECSDPRDRIYALLNLADDRYLIGVKPDYSQTPRQVFQDVVLRELGKNDTLHLLACCELQDGSEVVPTWVPNFSTPALGISLGSPSFYWTHRAKAHYAGGGILKVTGFDSATLISVERIFSQSVVTFSEGESVLKRLAASYLDEGRNVSGVDILEAFCRTLCCNRFAGHFIPSLVDYPLFEASRDCLRDFLESSTQREPMYKEYVNHFVHYGMGRSFVTAIEGYIGLAPQAAKPGDQVCIVLGCSSPLLLRSDGHGYHTVVGECYVHGIMEGETFLGPLPSPWRSALKRDTEGNFDCFVNQENGNIQPEDPRLGPLPPGWRVEDHEEMHLRNLYVNDDIGVESTTDFDPRLTAEALTARGVELTEFKLK